MSVRNLENSQLWWQGPLWLKEPNYVLPRIEKLDENPANLELRNKFKDIAQNKCSLENREKLFDVNKYSCFSKLLRVTAWILRFVNNVRNSEKLIDSLSAYEIQQAEDFWIRDCQAEAYGLEINDLKNSSKVKNNSSIVTLVPYLDNAILRIKGRLEKSELSFEEKHPILLPRNSNLTELIVKYEHEKSFHSGVAVTLVRLRRKYWIPKGRQLVKKIIGKCLLCKKYTLKSADQITAQLPKDRICETPPFDICGLDFAGPLFYKDEKESKKCYVALFTCAVTRAVHLELVSSMSTKYFMLAFRRFLARRGNSTIIYSDNAKSFKCANKDLQYFSNILKNSELQDFSSSRGIQWKFIVERAPWWGGFYERLVKSVKDPLRKILGKALLNFEELSTVLTEVETIVNSRPLTFLNDNFSEPKPLTPLHFLQYGKEKIGYPINFAEILNKASNKESLTKRKLYQTNLLKQVWRKWKEQYLLDLRTAHHFKTPDVHGNLKVDDIVLVEGSMKSKLLWDLGIVKELFPGRDGYVRACNVKTAKGTFRKPIQLLYPLEVPNG